MPKDTLQKQKQKQQYGEILGKKEVDDFQKHLFDVDKFGGTKEAEERIERYSKKVTLSEEDKKILRENVPEAPSFTAMRKEQYDKQGCWNKGKYKNKVKDYYKYREKYYTAKDESSKGKKLTKGQLYANKIAEIEERIKEADKLVEQTEIKQDIAEKKADTAKVGNTVATEKDSIEDLRAEADKTAEKYRNVEGLFDDINEFEIKEVFEKRRDNPEVTEAEHAMAEKDIKALEKQYAGFRSTIKDYAFTGYNAINRNLRQGWCNSNIKKVTDVMRKNPIKRDMVVRRGVNNLNTIAHMLNLENADKISEEELKKHLKDMWDGGEEMIVQDKAFMSTALPHATKMFDAGSDNSIGIEFMILLKKGTAAVNIESLSRFKEEAEVLVAPGTKFKIVDMELDGEKDIMKGNKGSWRIYLESIPVCEEGKLKEAA